MQVVEDSKFNLVSSVNKYSASVNANNNSSVVANAAGGSSATTTGNSQYSNNSHQTSILRNEQTPKVQYLGPNCLLIVYNEKEIATLLDEHFTKSLSGTNEHRTTHRTFPPSFWNRYYYRSPRNNVSSTSIASNPAAASSFGYYPDPYSSLLRPPPGSSIWTQYAAGSSSQSSSNVVGPSRDFADVYYGGLPDGNRLHLTDTHSTYNQLLGLGRSAATRIQPPPQYSTIRGDWPVFPTGSDYPQSTYPFQTGAESASTHSAHSETQIKETPFWFPVA